MPDPTKPPDWMAHQVMAQLDGVFPSAAEMHDAAVLAHYERRLTEVAATIADIRDRLRVLEPMVCEGCGCAARANPSDVDDSRLCVDCDVEHWPGRLTEDESVEAACLSVGLRALCGRRLTEGCE